MVDPLPVERLRKKVKTELGRVGHYRVCLIGVSIPVQPRSEARLFAVGSDFFL